MKQSLFMILLLFLLFSGRREHAYAMEQNTPGKPVTTGASEETQFYPNVVDLYFPSAPSTGYSWFAQTEDESLLEIEEEFFPDRSVTNLTDAEGTHWFRLRGLREGTTSVRLTYARPWKPVEKSCTEYSFVIRISVDARKNVLIWGIEMGTPAV